MYLFGGSGFIGTYMTKILIRNNANFTIIDKVKSSLSPSNSIVLNIQSLDSLAKVTNFGYSCLINLAAEHRDDVSPVTLYDDTNVTGAKNICHFANCFNVTKIIFTSSVAVYGFAPLGTNESGMISPFNDYGRTKWEAENIYKAWQLEDPDNRTLVIIRPTVVFGERNRGNVFNLLKQIASGTFFMVGNGLNRKSMAYVENVAAFLYYSLNFKSGIHIYNYVDKPDFTMNQLISLVNKLLGRSSAIKYRIPFSLGFMIGKSFDFVAKLTGKKFSISAIRVKKFCANSVYESAIDTTDFIPPVPLVDAIVKTVRYEFIDNHEGESIFYSE
jgi:nucleoside-diphosphate-sugar epimerase